MMTIVNLASLSLMAIPERTVKRSVDLQASVDPWTVVLTNSLQVYDNRLPYFVHLRSSNLHISNLRMHSPSNVATC